MPDRRITALLLDLDGTIADTHDLIHQCLDFTLRRHAGFGIQRTEWERYVGVPLRGIFATLFNERGAGAVTEAAVQEMTDSYRGRLREIDHCVEAFPGVLETLSELRRRRIRLAVVTTKHESAAHRTIGYLGMADLFDAVVCGDHCAHYKPHPDPFLLALERLGATAGSAAGIGDSRFDVEGSRAAGALAVGAAWGAVDRDVLAEAGADRILERPQEMLELIT